MSFMYTHIKNLEWSSGIYAAAAKSHQSYHTLCDPIDSSPPGFPVPGILQARTLEWAAYPFSSRSSQPRNWISARMAKQLCVLKMANELKPPTCVSVFSWQGTRLYFSFCLWQSSCLALSKNSMSVCSVMTYWEPMTPSGDTPSGSTPHNGRLGSRIWWTGLCQLSASSQKWLHHQRNLRLQELQVTHRWELTCDAFLKSTLRSSLMG